MIQKPDSGVDIYYLALARLAGMGLDVVDQARVGLRREVAAIEVDGQLDFGFVGIARERSPAGFGGFGHCAGIECLTKCVKGGGMQILQSCANDVLIYLSSAPVTTGCMQFTLSRYFLHTSVP